MTLQRAVIVGASHAGTQLAASLRQEGWDGEIVLVGDESVLPYQRPPLSKAYLAGKSTLDELAIRSAEFYTKQEIQTPGCDGGSGRPLDQPTLAEHRRRTALRQAGPMHGRSPSEASNSGR